MSKLIWLLVVAGLACKLLFKRWPWELLGIPHKSPELERARALLGVSAHANRAQIIEAHRNLITQVHPDRGGTSGLVHEANEARDALLAVLPKPETEH